MTPLDDSQTLQLILARFDQLEKRFDDLVTQREFQAFKELVDAKVGNLEDKIDRHEEVADLAHIKLENKLRDHKTALSKEQQEKINRGRWVWGTVISVLTVVINVLFNLFSPR